MYLTAYGMNYKVAEFIDLYTSSCEDDDDEEDSHKKSLNNVDPKKKCLDPSGRKEKTEGNLLLQEDFLGKGFDQADRSSYDD